MKNVKIKSKILFTYIILITLPVIILSARSYTASKDVILDLAKQNVWVIVQKNNQILDNKLSVIRQKSLNLNVDCSLYETFNGANPHDSYSFLNMNSRINQLIHNYFASSPEIYSVQLATSYNTFGDNTKMFVPPEDFTDSSLYRTAASSHALVWIPTYDYTDMFHLNIPRTADARYLFSAAQTLNVSCVSHGKINYLPAEAELPVLVMNFNESLFRHVFDDNSMIRGSSYFIAGPGGHIVSAQDRTKLATTEQSPWLQQLIQAGSGTMLVEVDGAQMIACFDTSSVTGWVSVVLIPPEALMGGILQTTKSNIVYLAVALTILSILFAYGISARITDPISKLIRGIEKVGIGNFNVKINGKNNYEFRRLFAKFNEMNDKIKNLIEENYMVQIREKEAEIMALNIQLNPHFLYNTLNVINWMAIHNEKEKISKMLVSLSRMLQYTTDNRQETTPLGEDLKWLDQYIYIMTNRFEDRFAVRNLINPMLMEAKVPKLFLQPFVENAIIHGFNERAKDGLIQIFGWVQEDTVYFSVEDNGCGFDANLLRQADRSSRHFGIHNVDKRIKLLYGDAYGVQVESEAGKGTRVLITIPLEP